MPTPPVSPRVAPLTLGCTRNEIVEGEAVGRAGQQAPEVDGDCVLAGHSFTVGDLVRCRVVGGEGVDLVVEPVELLAPPGGGT